MIIWLPEKMNADCGNKLLKLIEEPPFHTFFFLITENPDTVLPTLVSRSQRFTIPPLEEKEIADWLIKKYMLQHNDANDIAHLSEGSVLKAIENIHISEENKLFFNYFTQLMRLAYARKVKEIKEWSEQIASLGRERQKKLLEYFQYMIRESFVYNFHCTDMIYLGKEEAAFTSRFAPFITERNILNITEVLTKAQQHIEQNANPKFVFFDSALKMILLIKQR